MVALKLMSLGCGHGEGTWHGWKLAQIKYADVDST